MWEVSVERRLYCQFDLSKGRLGAVDVDAIKQLRGTIDGQDHPRLVLLLLHVSREKSSPPSPKEYFVLHA